MVETPSKAGLTEPHVSKLHHGNTWLWPKMRQEEKKKQLSNFLFVKGRLYRNKVEI